MNANAKPFVFNPGATSWTPSFSPPKPAEAVPPAPVPEPTVLEEPTEVGGEEDEAIDENDPLWIATLKLAEGDREKAVKMLADPDSLIQYPEIRAIMEAAEGGDVELTEVAAAEVPAVVVDAVVAPTEVKKAETPLTPSKAETQEEAADAPSSTTEDLTLSEGDPREHLNLVFIGHVDAGKSTLSGSILYLMGKVDKRTIERFEREAKERNRESWFLAFILDTSEEERAKGKTVEVGRAHFETEKNRYTILDAPGHKNYVPNMISGAAQADVGILVISARRGEFETGFEKGGQTREHALLARTLGVQHLVVVVNKMDDPTVEWDRARYEECVGKLKPYLKNCGYVIKKDVKFVPISGLNGDNVLNEVQSSKCPWWKEMYSTGGHNTFTPTLLSTLDSLAISNRNPDGPLRVPCLDRYFERGCVVMGKVESGTLRVGDEVVLAPTKKKAKVEEIIIVEDRVRCAKPGEDVMIKFQINVEDIQKGYVLCSPLQVCPAVTEVKVQLALVDMLEHRPLFTPGYEAVMHVHTVEIEVTCLELVCVIDKGNKIRRPFARTGQGCIAKLQMPLNTCMEPFDVMPSLGRLTLRDEGRTIAIGKILEVITK
jgi:peptide chain release factor subunit 3